MKNTQAFYSVPLGRISWEALGLMLDPFKRQLRPLPAMLASLPGLPQESATS